MLKTFHSYHMVNMSPWPLMIGLSVLFMMIGFINSFILKGFNLFFMSMIMLLVIVIMWWRDVIRESTYQGNHSSYVVSGLMMGMILFIVSEVLFFFSFFWAFFHSSLNSTMELGVSWPPFGIDSLAPFQVPLLNTIILLSSGVSITCAHQSILSEKWVEAKIYLMMTWMLGIYFMFMQGFEYLESSFNVSDSVFGSVFFVATGFHGLHVFIGTFFLLIMSLRIKFVHFSMSHHLGFEFAAWYWHFVDVVWLFLFSVVYWWGS